MKYKFVVLVHVSSSHLLLHHIFWFCFWKPPSIPTSQETGGCTLNAVADSWAFNFLVTEIVVPTPTQNSIYDMTNITFRNCVCVCVLRSTIIWCSQRFHCALELICLFTKICSHTQSTNKKTRKKHLKRHFPYIVYYERYNDQCATPTSRRWFGFFSLLFCHDISALFTRSTILKMWTKKKEKTTVC